MTIATVVAISGMIFDILGAVILARTFVVKRPLEVFQEVKSFGCWDFPITVGARNLLLSWLVQAREAKTGAVILAFGFALQALAQVLPNTALPSALAIVVLSLTISVCMFFWLQSSFVRSAAHEARGFYVELDGEAIPDDWRREIPLRCKELSEIERQPGKWLKLGEPKASPPDSSNKPTSP